MKHGDPPNKGVRIPQEEYDKDPAMWAGLYTSMTEYLLLERAFCSCEATCTCDF